MVRGLAVIARLLVVVQVIPSRYLAPFSGYAINSHRPHGGA